VLLPIKEEEVTMMTEPALGIDIAKLKFNVCLINPSGKLKHSNRTQNLY
jgi:hypothetical protein